MKIKFFCFFVLFNLALSINIFANEFDFYSSYHQPGLLTINVEDIEKPYTVQVSYEGQNYHTVLNDCYEDFFELYRLANGVTYYIKVIDSNGFEKVKRYTTPYTVVPSEQLKIINITDDSCTVDWSYLNAYYDVNVYLDGYLVRTLPVQYTSVTLDGLESDTEYIVHITTKTGYVSNVVTFKTTNFGNSFFARLDDLLKKIFVPDNTYDGNFNGIPDTYDGVMSAWNRWKDYNPVSVGSDTANLLKDLTGDFEGSDEFPDLVVNFGGGLTFNVLDFSEFETQIEMIRKLLQAVIWITFFMFLVRLLIPIFKV